MTAATEPECPCRDVDRPPLGPAHRTLSACVLALCFASAAETPAAQVAPPFAGPTSYAAGNDPTAVVVRDVTRDGKPDLVVVNEFLNTVSVMPGQGGGVFGAPTSYAVGTLPVAVAVGDFNADGRLDLVVANQSSNTVSLLLGQVGGTFGAATNFATGTGPGSVTVGDLNRDGKLDIAVANYFSNSVSVLLNQTPSGGPLAFTAATNFGVGSHPRCVAVADIDVDGKLDLVSANSFSNTVSVLLNQTPDAGSAAFATAVNHDVGVDPYSVAVADLSGDGKPDLAVTGILSIVSVLLGQGGGVFGAMTNYAVGSQPGSRGHRRPQPGRPTRPDCGQLQLGVRLGAHGAGRRRVLPGGELRRGCISGTDFRRRGRRQHGRQARHRGDEPIHTHGRRAAQPIP